MKKFNFLCFLAMLFCGLSAHAAAELTFSNVSLAPGSKVEILSQDQQITFNTNMDSEIGYMYAEIQDETGKVVLARTTVYDPNFNNNGNGQASNVPQNFKDPHFTFVCPASTKMEEGHTYSIVFNAYTDKDASHGNGEGNVLAKGAIKYEGASPAYIGSRFKLLNITPDPKTAVITGPENATVTMHFNGKVTMNSQTAFINAGSGMSSPLKSIVPAGAEIDTVTTVSWHKDEAGKDVKVVTTEVFSDSWALTPTTGTLAGGADVIFSANAYDKAGLHVSEGTEYSTGATETSYYTFSFANDYGRETFEITPNENIKTLSSVVVKSGSGIAVANVVEPAVLYQVAEDGTKTEVAQIKWNANLVVKHASDDDYPTEVRLMFDKATTKAGNYVLHFPRGYFNIGSGMMANGTAATDVEYTIAKDATPYEVAFSPADGEKITKLDKVEVAFTDLNDDEEPKYELGFEDMEKAKAYFYDDHNELVTTGTFDYATNWDDYNKVVVTLDEAIVDPGKYTMVIPDGQFTYSLPGGGMMAKNRIARGGTDMGDGSDDSEDPDYNALIVKEFTVEAGSTDDVTLKMDIEEGATLPSVSAVNLTFEGAETVSVDEATMVWWKGDVKKSSYLSVSSVKGNVLTIQPSSDMYSGTTIDKAANYTLTIPAGFIKVNGSEWPEVVLHFTIDPSATGINGVNADASAAKTVYTLDGVRVNGEAKNGAFIVNGKKVVLK